MSIGICKYFIFILIFYTYINIIAPKLHIIHYPIVSLCKTCNKYTDKNYKNKQASPKEKNLYLFSTATLYISRTFSLPAKAEINIINVL